MTKGGSGLCPQGARVADAVPIHPGCESADTYVHRLVAAIDVPQRGGAWQHRRRRRAVAWPSRGSGRALRRRVQVAAAAISQLVTDNGGRRQPHPSVLQISTQSLAREHVIKRAADVGRPRLSRLLDKVASY